MPQIFHPSMNTLSRVTIFGAVGFVVVAMGIGAGIVRSPYVTAAGVVRTQPVPFSHQQHVGQVGLDCRYCHQTVETAASAGMPATEVCLDCHSQLFADSPMLAPIRDSLANGKPVIWNRVHDLPDFAYFDHSIHVRKGMRCEVCHGRVDRMPLMWRQATLHMEWCLDCHRHPERFVAPREAVFEMGWSRSANDPSPQELMEQYRIRSKTDCSICHR